MIVVIKMIMVTIRITIMIITIIIMIIIFIKVIIIIILVMKIKIQYYCYSRLLGLCNNFAYVIMLSAAHDILHPLTPDANVSRFLFPHNVCLLNIYCAP